LKASAQKVETNKGEKLPRKADVAIAALLSQPTMADAAKEAGVSESTLWRWLQQTDFQSKYKEAQRCVVDSSLGKLQAATSEAVNTLRRNLTCGKAGDEIRAAAVILDQSAKYLELYELRERIAHLEAKLKDREDGA